MGLKRILLSEITRNPEQPRQTFEKGPLMELANSIKTQGLQQPIVVRPIKSNLSGFREGVKYMIVLGERRYRAHELLAEWGKLEDGKILCNIRDMSDEEMHVVAIVENMHRADVTPLEEARAFKRLVDNAMSPEALAGKLGISIIRVNERLSLLKLDPQLQKFVENGTLPTKNAVEIARLPLHQQIPLLKRIASGELRNWYEIRGVVTGLLEANEQGSLMDMPPPVTEEDVRTLNGMEAKVARVMTVVAQGWKDNECVIAKKVSPDRCRLMAEQLGQIAKSLGLMQRQLLLAAGQGELTMTYSDAGAEDVSKAA